jgi:Ty3 transposon capsid-like protein
MTSREPESPDPPRSPTPLDYVDPNNPFEQDMPHEPDGNPGDDHGGPDGPDGNPDPGDPDDNDDDDDPPDDPNPIPPPTDNRQEGDRFIEALMHLSGSLQSLRRDPAPKSEKIKVREPDTFDGSNPRKLRDFLVSCNLHFRDRPHVYASDEKRILFILSYLKGSALSWFEPGLNDPTDSAHWMWNYPAFLSELEDNFGPHDPVGDAEKSLNELQMKKSTRIVKYNVDFWELASRVDWNESALSDRYFRGLPLRLRTEVLRGGKPETLAALRLKAQEADNIYWMQEEEMRVESKHSAPTGNPNKKDSQKPFTPYTSSSNFTPKPSSQNRNHSHSTSSKFTPKGASKDKPKNSIADKLGKNGKLTGDERERRMKEGLCLYCGEKDHVAHDCPKAQAAKARSAKVSAPEPKADAADSKK